MGDVDMFTVATEKVKKRTIYGWQTARDLRLAIEYDRPENIPALVEEAIRTNSTLPDNLPEGRISTALTYSVRHGCTRSFKALVANDWVASKFTARDTNISWAAKYGHGDMVDIMLGMPCVDSCTARNFKQSGVYKAFRWAMNSRKHHIIELLSTSTSLQTFLKDDADLQDARQKLLVNERLRQRLLYARRQRLHHARR